jgi:ACS family D-galactonate transporter-like MFS transporter
VPERPYSRTNFPTWWRTGRGWFTMAGMAGSDARVSSPTQSTSTAARRWTIIGLLSAGMVIAYVSRGNLSVVLVVPEFIRSFGLSDADRGALNSAFFWAYAVLQIPAGWVVDRYGVKRPYAIGFLFWCVTSGFTAFVGSLWSLYVLRVLVGAGEAVVAPASYRWIRVNFEEKQRGLAIGLYMTGTKIGPAIAAPLAAWLVMKADWRSMFLIVGFGGLLWLLPWLLLVKDNGSSLPRISAGPPAGAVPFAKVLASPVTWGAVIATFCYMYFVYFCMTWMPAYFVEQRHLTLSKMGLYTFFSFGGMAIVAALAGWSADLLIARGRNPVTVRKWFTIAGFAVACTELIGARSPSVRVALATANYWALTQTLIPAAAIGRISGVQNCSASVAGIVAPILTGWLKQQTGSYEAPMRAIWFFLVLGVLSYLILVREKYAPRAR